MDDSDTSAAETAARPDLSIVIVEWNTIDMLRDCLASVFANRNELALQVIVVDNASADGSPEMVEDEFPEVEQIRNQDNLGFAAANNQGFEISNGRHVLLLNSDTYVLGDVLSKSVRYLDERPKVGAMGCRVLNPDSTMQATCSGWPSNLDLIFSFTGLSRLRWPEFLSRFRMTHWKRDDERPVEVISGCYMMVRSEVLEQVGLLDEEFFFFGEETDWCRRIANAGWQLMFAPVGEIVHYGSASARKLNHRRDLLLTGSLVRLHRKHQGIFSAAVTWSILFFFNLSRAFFWSLRSLGNRVKHGVQAKHFWNVTIGMLLGEAK